MKKKIFAILLTTLALIAALCVIVACDGRTDPLAPSTRKYTITFDSLGGQAVESITADEGSDITDLLPSDPSHTSYVFGGWSRENNGFASRKEDLPTVMPGENVTFYARWVRTLKIVPSLQTLGADGTPATGEDAYVPDEQFAKSYEVNPNTPNVDLYNYDLPDVVGFRNVATSDEMQARVDVKQKTVYLKYNLRQYTVSFDANDSTAIGEMQPKTLYFGQELELPESDFLTPYSLRFAGWATDSAGVNFAPAGQKAPLGGNGSLIDGKVTNVTLYAIYDEGYFDYSYGDDYVFVPAREGNKAIIRRGGDSEFEGAFFPHNPTDSDPSTGTFLVELPSGVSVTGRVYSDGHFAYVQTSLNVDGLELVGGDVFQEKVYDHIHFKFVDGYGAATLTLDQPLTIYSTDSYYDVVQTTLQPGAYFGGYWQDIFSGDFCFSIMRTVTYTDGDEESVQFDIHFMPISAEIQENPSSSAQQYNIMQMRGREAGLFAENFDEEGYLVGDRIVLDGYGNAIVVTEDDSQFEGDYSIVGDGDVIVSATSDSNDYIEMFIRPDYSMVLGMSMLRLPVMTYKSGDSSSLAYCTNPDGSKFEADGFGNGVYTDATGKAEEGEVTLVGERFEDASPAIVYSLKTASGEYSIIVDSGTATGEFIKVNGHAELNYLYNASFSSYVGAIVETAEKAFYLTANESASGNIIFVEVSEGTVTTQQEGKLFSGKEYVIYFADDPDRTSEKGIPTVVTHQMTLAELTFDVLDLKGQPAGQLALSGDGKAKYTNGEDTVVFENQEYGFAYGMTIMGEEGAFLIDTFGTEDTNPTALLIQMAMWGIADGDENGGILFEYYGGFAMFRYIGTSDEPRFYGHGTIAQATGEYPKPIYGKAEGKDDTVYRLSVSGSTYYAIKQEEEFYLFANMTLASGTFSYKENETAKAETLQVDCYGNAKYSVPGAEGAEDTVHTGTFSVQNNVYVATFEDESTLKFMPSAADATFAKVGYSDYLVLNPATLRAVYLIRIWDDGSKAELYNISSSNSSYTIGERVRDDGKVEQKADGNTFEFKSRMSAEAEYATMFEFYYSDMIMSERTVVESNPSLPSGTFTEDGAKSIQLDNLGRATYNDGNGGTYSGYYYNNGGMYRFRDLDNDIDVSFSLDLDGHRLIIYDPHREEVTSGEYLITIDGTEYTISINFNTLEATLLQAGDQVVAGTLLKDAYGIYSFEAIDADYKPYSAKFIIDENDELKLYDEDLELHFEIYSGNIYLYEAGHSTIDGDPTVMLSGSLTIKGFYEVAELVTGQRTMRGSVSYNQQTKTYVFIAQNGRTELLEREKDGEPYLAAYGLERGMAYEFYYTATSASLMLSETPSVYFDGLGHAYRATTAGQGSLIGDYMFGSNPYDPDDDSTDFIKVGTLSQDASSFEIVQVYKSYPLSREDILGNTEYLVGVVAYNEAEDKIVYANDGSILHFNGFDDVEFYDSLGVEHAGNFNNFGVVYAGEKDTRYIIQDENDNTLMYVVDFATGSARRISYNIFSPSSMSILIEVYNEEDFAKYGQGAFEEGMDGYALITIFTAHGSYELGGFFEAEGGLLTIHVEDGSGDIEIELYYDGFAEWTNFSDWMQ